MARPSKNRKTLAAGTVQNANFFIAAVSYVHVFLRFISGEFHPASRTDPGLRRCLALDKNISFKATRLIKYLNSATKAVTNVDKPVIADDHAMNNLQEHSWNASICLSLVCLSTPLA